MGQTYFKGITDFGRSMLLDQTESNIVEFFKWSLLGIGAFYDVTIPTSGAFGGKWHQMRPVSDPNYADGQVWEGARQDWVWESGVQYSAQPIQVSGVYVNGAFQHLGSGVNLDYPLGRFIFNNPIATSSVVTAEYSFRLWQVSPSNVGWFREIDFQSFRVDDSQYFQFGSGVWSVLAENRVQLPAMVVHVTNRRKVVGHALGGDTRHYPQVVFHILGEQPDHVRQMVDIVCRQMDVSLDLFDKNAMADANAFPLNYDGTVASGAMTYPNLCSTYPWQKLTFVDFTAMDSISSPPLFHAAVISTVEVILPV